MVPEPFSDPAMEWLLLVARPLPTAATVERLRALAAGGLDWPRVLELARLHGLASLVDSRLQGRPLPDVPAPIRSQLREQSRANALRSLAAGRELLHLVALLQQRHLRVIAFKGPVLAVSAYGSLAVREFLDLDILVPLSDLPAAKSAMLSDGYRLRKPLSPVEEDGLLRTQCEYQFWRPDGMAVDLHWAFTPRYFRFPVDFDDLWRRRATVELGGRPTPTLGPEDTLTVLCVHGCKAGWSQLKWVVDIAESVQRNPDMDWAGLLARAEAAGAGRMVRLGLQLAGDLLGTPQPPIDLLLAEQRHIRKLAAACAGRLRQGVAAELGPFAMTLFQMRLQRRIRNRFAIAARVALLPNHVDAAETRLPPAMAALRYPLRPARLLVKYLRKIPIVNRSLVRYVGDLARAIGPKLWLLLAIMLGLALVEGVGIMLLIPILQQLGLDVRQGAVGRLASATFSLLRWFHIPPSLLNVLALYVLVMGAYALLQRWQDIMSFAVHTDFAVILRKRLYAAIARADWNLFTRSRSSDFMQALTTESTRIAVATQSLLSLAVNGGAALVYLFFAFQLSPPATALVLGAGGLLWVLLRRVARPSRTAGQELTVAMNEMYAAINDHLAGMKVAKSYNAEARNVAVFSRLADSVSERMKQAVRSQATLKSLFDTGSVLILAATTYVAIRWLGVPVSALLLLIFLFARAMPRFSAMQQSFERFMNMVPAFENVKAIEARCLNAAEASAMLAPVSLRHRIRLEGVVVANRGWAVPGTSIDLTIPAGRMTALVGRSGAGKTTIADVVVGLVKPARGRVSIDDDPLTAERLGTWREMVGYVEQDSFLFHASVRDNLLWARPKASEDEIWEALDRSYAADLVRRLPRGLDTVVGDRGMRISGGERQRLALARALIRQPALLILDEATNHLDYESEAQIRLAVDRLRGRVTILLITHRLTAIRDVDQICMVDHGVVLESGTWIELMANPDGALHGLWTAQQSGDEGATLSVVAGHER